jgi:hypothetical protein
MQKEKKHEHPSFLVLADPDYAFLCIIADRACLCAGV